MKKDKNNGLLKIMCAYSVVMLTLLILGVNASKGNGSTTAKDVIVEEKIKTEYVYVNVNTDDEIEIDNNVSEPRYTVREHMQKVGIFTEDGTLVKTLEVYVKTLPEADRRLLEEGFEIIGNTQLYSIIEDYSG